MKATNALLMLAARLTVNAVTADNTSKTLAAIDKRGASRFSCGQYKIDDGIVQEFYSQVWAGLPADRMICRHFKYKFRDKKGQEGIMVAAKVDFGCTCFFHEKPCDPNDGLTEVWSGWMGWGNYVSTDKKFKGWYCFEQA